VPTVDYLVQLVESGNYVVLAEHKGSLRPPQLPEQSPIGVMVAGVDIHETVPMPAMLHRRDGFRVKHPVHKGDHYGGHGLPLLRHPQEMTESVRARHPVNSQVYRLLVFPHRRLGFRAENPIGSQGVPAPPVQKNLEAPHRVTGGPLLEL
jgi:hypothetical protein